MKRHAAKRSAAALLVTALALVVSGFESTRILAQQPPSMAEPLHQPLDQILDLYVRDGYVYYRALRIERGRLDRYVASLNVAPAVYDKWSREQKIALWLNAYNAFVLQTVINRFPIAGRSKSYPANSIRQIPGAFDQKRHRAAGKLVSLDDIETALAEFRDPRLYFALGRGAEGSGRLRSEAYTAARLEEQLATQTQDFLTRQNHLKIDTLSNQISVSPIISWHEAEFAAAFAGGGAVPAYASSRSPIEKAVLALIVPVALPTERAFLEQNQFKLTWQEFDWSLNDLGVR
jgi:Protein of unknown function, DUF547